MQQVSELVEDGLHVTMRQQRRAAIHGRREIAAHQSEVRLGAIFFGKPSDEGVHPRAAALSFAWIPIGIERPEQRSIRVVNSVHLHVRVPHGRAPLLRHANSVKALDGFKHALHHALQREVGAQGFLIEIVERGALFLGVIGNIPGCKFAGGVSFDAPAERGQLFVFGAESRLGLFFQLCQEILRALAGVRHAIFQHEVGETGEA